MALQIELDFTRQPIFDSKRNEFSHLAFRRTNTLNRMLKVNPWVRQAKKRATNRSEKKRNTNTVPFTHNPCVPFWAKLQNFRENCRDFYYIAINIQLADGEKWHRCRAMKRKLLAFRMVNRANDTCK